MLPANNSARLPGLGMVAGAEKTSLLPARSEVKNSSLPNNSGLRSEAIVFTEARKRRVCFGEGFMVRGLSSSPATVKAVHPAQ